MTVHKSQGQTLEKVGLDFRNQPFTHGMTYVALSRACRADDITVCVAKKFKDVESQRNCVTNVVYKPLLQACSSIV